MANNRAFFYCPPCKEAICIGKHGGTWFNIRVSIGTMDSFFEKHAFCGPSDCMACGSHIELRYEQTAERTDELPSDTTVLRDPPDPPSGGRK